MARRFFAPPESFQGSKILLGADEAKHLRDVLRLRENTKINVFNGAGREFSAKIEIIRKNEAVLEIIEEIQPSAPESDLNLTLAVALLKGEKFDLVVQKAGELGVTKIVPLETKRADVKIRDAGDAVKKVERWRRIALESAKQSGRARLLKVDAPISFESFIRDESAIKILFAERNGKSFDEFLNENSAIEKMTAIVGAEGGWEDSEIELAGKYDSQIITLGGRILRAETAAVTVSALLQNRFGDLR